MYAATGSAANLVAFAPVSVTPAHQYVKLTLPASQPGPHDREHVLRRMTTLAGEGDPFRKVCSCDGPSIAGPRGQAEHLARSMSKQKPEHQQAIILEFHRKFDSLIRPMHRVAEEVVA